MHYGWQFKQVPNTEFEMRRGQIYFLYSKPACFFLKSLSRQYTSWKLEVGSWKLENMEINVSILALYTIFFLFFISGIIYACSYYYQISYLLKFDKSERPEWFYYSGFVESYIDFRFTLRIIKNDCGDDAGNEFRNHFRKCSRLMNVSMLLLASSFITLNIGAIFFRN
ncbi:hypothetical protein LF844_12410 [Metapseudomonas lalkuanensis]|uniref:hypothetical protein n=1 Tax=Metapseudomonas lalkuanensis TaxID=2604832 RepID=UPI001CF5F966|nr:hypothetical protein [Pseudomonas lalkuanensis]UCP00572.1 hypothetical protein LF844_12410 [Pseudomonas lalkuanensis]